MGPEGSLTGDGRFERIVEEHAPSVYRIVAGHLGQGEAEDAAQEVFTRVYLGLSGFKGESSVATWIFRIATNTALTRGRRRRNRPRPERIGSLEREEPREGPAALLEASERREAVRRAIAQLPEEQRAVVVLRNEGLSFEEVAQVLGILRPTAESRMARAKERLRALLEKYVKD